MLTLVFVILTDGRYFGKGFMFKVYDTIGPHIFNAHTESERWLLLAQNLHLSGTEMIIDIGTATGDLPLTLAALPGFQGRVTGLDWSANMIATAQHEAKQRQIADRTAFTVGDVRQKLPFPDDTFDIVICFGLLETVPQPELILKEFRRILKADGKMALSLYRGWSSKSVALDLSWYQEHLKNLQMTRFEVVACRRNQNVLIASRT